MRSRYAQKQEALSRRREAVARIDDLFHAVVEARTRGEAADALAEIVEHERWL